jgi:pSer/pThr/pTyr-binding forkhead associated (FHA) protein
VKKGKLWVVFDLGSSNGTFVQGRQVQENALKNGFVVEFGQVKFRFVET